MTKKLAEVISLILNPLFLVLLIILLGVEESGFSRTDLMIFTIAALVLNGFLPVYFVMDFYQRGIVIDDIFENKEVLKNRASIIAWGAIIFFFEIVVLYFYKRPQPLFAIIITLALLTLALFVINIYRKISLHAAGITTFSLIILLLFGLSFWPILVLIPIIFWSRLYLERHTKKQLAAGFLLSCLVVFFVFYCFKLLNF